MGKYLLPARDSGRPEAGCGWRRQRRLPDLAAAAEAVVGRPAPRRRRGRAEAAGFVSVGAHLRMISELGCVNTSYQRTVRTLHFFGSSFSVFFRHDIGYLEIDMVIEECLD